MKTKKNKTENTNKQTKEEKQKKKKEILSSLKTYLQLSFSIKGEKIEKINKKYTHLITWNVLYLFLITLLGIALNIYSGNYSTYSTSSLIISILLGFPLILLLIYSILHLFILAFTSKKKRFWQTYLIYLMITLPFIFLTNLLNSIFTILKLYGLTQNYGTSIIFAILYIVIIIWYLILFINSFRKYYQTTNPVIISSLLLSIILYTIILTIFYLNYLLMLIH